MTIGKQMKQDGLKDLQFLELLEISITVFYQILVARSFPDSCCKWLKDGEILRRKENDSNYFIIR